MPTIQTPQVCNRCGRHISRTETAHVWQAREVVCTECFTGLRGAVVNPPPHPFAPAVDPLLPSHPKEPLAKSSPAPSKPAIALPRRFSQLGPVVLGVLACGVIMFVGNDAPTRYHFDSDDRMIFDYLPTAVDVLRQMHAVLVLASLTFTILLVWILLRLPPRQP